MKVIVVSMSSSNQGLFRIERLVLALVPENNFEELALQAIKEGKIKVALEGVK